MYPEKTLDEVKLDNDADGYHFGLYLDHRLTSIVSLFKDGDTMQLRKFATLHNAQGKGYGSQLLEYVISFCRQNHTRRIWCNARTNAAGFYSRYGFSKTNETYSKDGHDFVIMEVYL